MPGGGELAILTERVDIDGRFCETHLWARPGSYVRLTVSDTGVGMDAATQARIFEPFFTTKEMGRGTGLGLAVVYGIVRQHEGLIPVYSEPGKGTAFRIYIPFQEGTREMRTALPEPVLEEGTETILLAEDDEILRNTATRLLERLGYQVIAAADGKEALTLLETRHQSIQLVVLDMVMPGLGGGDVYEQAHRRYPHLRFIFTSGYSRGTAHLAPIHTLPSELLMKPYGVRALAKAVRQQLDRER
jgi:two-component system cell cycle sensor histidine kinase/response regulator CckA